MPLIPWKHPVSGQLRLYVPCEAVPELRANAGHIKAWFERGSVKHDTWALKLKDVEELDTTKVEQAIVRYFHVDPSTPWSSLARSASAKPKKSKSDIETIRLPIPLVASVSDKEPPTLAEILDQHPHLEVLPGVPLPVGSLRVVNPEGAQLLIWRVSCDPGEERSFDKALRDRYWFNAADRLSDALSDQDIQSTAAIILEGDPYRADLHLSQAQVDGALAYTLSVQRVSVLFTHSLEHTASFMVRLAGQFAKALEGPPGHRPGKPKLVTAHQQYILESLPGVSDVIAQALLAHFGSVEAVMTASEEQLMAVPGLGRTKARRIRRLIAM